MVGSLSFSVGPPQFCRKQPAYFELPVFHPQTKAITNPTQYQPANRINQVVLTGQQSRQDDEHDTSSEKESPFGSPSAAEQSDQGCVEYMFTWEGIENVVTAVEHVKQVGSPPAGMDWRAATMS